MLRYCMVWGYKEKQSRTYFKERNVSLSQNHYYELKRELESDESTKGWYTEQAIFAMEKTHKQSIHQLDELIRITMIEIQQLQSTPVYIKQLENGIIDEIFNPNHDSTTLARMMEAITKLIATRDDMLAATPVVQAIVNKYAENQEKALVIQ